MSSRIRMADLFCGAGGTSTGAQEVLGDRLDLVAVNHWDIAIDTHSRNHPRAKHHRSSAYKLAPLDAVPSGRLDILVASPTCTFHSRARGGRPISKEQRYGRMTPTQVVRWCTDLDVRTLLVENVPEFVKWGPIHPAQPQAAKCLKAKCEVERPCKARVGSHFRAWVRKLERLGYKTESRILNAANYGDVTTRKRFFLIARKDGQPISWPEPSHSKEPSSSLFDGATAKWRGAREVIDWSLRGKSIFTRKKPLSPNTLTRIHAGAVRFGWAEAYLVVLRQHMSAQGLGVPVPTITAGGTHLGLAQPFVLPQRSDANPRRDLGDPLDTLTTVARVGVLIPQHSGGRARDSTEPCPTITTDGAHAFVVPGFGERKTQTPRTHSVQDPVPTVCATGHMNLVRARGVDILFRMLQPHELSAAMGFPADYEFAGNKTEVTRQIGNAVPVGTAAALIREIAKGL